MAKLIMTRDGAVVREFPIEQDSLSIGRRAGNDIQVNDLTVSGRHALVTVMGSNIYVEDLGSTNGTLVNGKRIKNITLKHGDVIQVGSTQFTYYRETEAEYQPTMFIQAVIEPTQVIDTRRQPDAEEVKGERLGVVRILSGPLENKVLELRKPFNTIGFNGIKMAIISRSPEGYTITALKGLRLRRASDLPLVNGIPIGFDHRKLKDHDVIEVSGTKMEFYFQR